MIRLLGTIFAGLLGLAFGSFLNVCLSRWPQNESIVQPRSHCRHCTHTLAWWENIPLASWLALRGRCRNCRARIGARYPLVELAVGVLWAVQAWQLLDSALDPFLPALEIDKALVVALGQMIFCWLIVALAVLDAENLWLPDWLTVPGIALGFVFTLTTALLSYYSPASHSNRSAPAYIAVTTLLGIFAAAGMVLLIRWVYWLLRHREGIGLGDAKLMALLAAWLGFPRTLLAFGLGVVLGAIVGIVLLAFSIKQEDSSSWAYAKLPLGTFLCIGGVISALWGEQIIAAYMILSSL